VEPVAVAAGQAVREAGTEVSATAVGGQPRGPRGRWAILLRRHRRPVTDRSELAEVSQDRDASERTEAETGDEAHIPGAAAAQ
jgi:hypothetical protein